MRTGNSRPPSTPRSQRAKSRRRWRRRIPELAKSFVDLALDRQVAIDPALVQKVDDAIKAENTATAKAGSFLGGLITGEPNDMVSLAGTALGDLFVFGDIRDAIREGSRLAQGQEADRLILGLAGVGIAITAGTYASMGTAAPARVGLSVVKAARKTGRLGTQLGEWIVRSMRGVVDWSAMRKAMAGASLTEPAVAVRAVREAVKVEKAGGLLDFARNVGRVQTKAGTRTALDGLKMANSPVEMARIAKLAEKHGNKTRAILKILGRGAIALTLAAFDLALWIFWALLMVFGFVSSMKAPSSARRTGFTCARKPSACARRIAAWQWRRSGVRTSAPAHKEFHADIQSRRC